MSQLAAKWAGVVNAKPRPLFPRKTNTVPIVQEALWAPGPVWIGAGNLAAQGFEAETVEPAVSRYTDLAMPVYTLSIILINSYTHNTPF